MRVSVQGPLVLLLCLFTPTVFGALYQYQGQGASFPYSTARAACDAFAADSGNYEFDDMFKSATGEPTENGSKWGTCQIHNKVSTWNLSSTQINWKQDSCPAPGTLNPETGECEQPAPTQDECLESGQLYDGATQSCVDECDHGAMNGVCLSGPIDNKECTAKSDDYRGELVLGYGKPPIKVCGDIDQCSGTGDDNKGQIGVMNGELRCIATDYGQPSCKGDTINVVDEYGFACEPLSNTPDEEEVAEAPNTDTDGDGEPDEYQRKHDPESVDKGLDKVASKIDKSNDKADTANQHLGKIEDAVKDIAKDVGSLEQMGKNGELGGGGSSGSGDGLKNDQGEDYLGDLADIKKNTKDTADTLEDIKDGPDEGYNTDALGDAPTFEETTDRLQSAITGNPTIQAVTTIPTIAENNTCPVWTIPATKFWDAMPLDAHCDILNDYQGQLSAMFIAFWTLSAVFVFLRA